MTEPTKFSPTRLAIGGMMAMASAVGIGRFIYTPILPAMADALHLSKGDAGLIASANFLGYLAGALMVASPRLTRRPLLVLQISLAISAATTAAMGACDTMTAFLALRFTGGFASAFVLVLASTLVLQRLAQTGRGGLAAIHFAGVGVGIVASAVIAALVPTSAEAWRTLWLVGGAAAITAVPVTWLLIPAASPASTEAQAKQAASLANRRDLQRLTLAYGLFGFGYVITATFIVAMVRGSAGAVSFEPLIWLGLGLAAIPSVAFWVAISRRFGLIETYGWACLAEAAGVLISVLLPGPIGLFAAGVLLGGTFVGITALGLMAGRSLAGPDPRRALAMLTAAFGFGQMVGPLVAGYGYDMTGSFAAASLIAAVALLIAFALARTIRTMRERGV